VGPFLCWFAVVGEARCCDGAHGATGEAQGVDSVAGGHWRTPAARMFFPQSSDSHQAAPSEWVPVWPAGRVQVCPVGFPPRVIWWLQVLVIVHPRGGVDSGGHGVQRGACFLRGCADPIKRRHRRDTGSYQLPCEALIVAVMHGPITGV